MNNTPAAGPRPLDFDLILFGQAHPTAPGTSSLAVTCSSAAYGRESMPSVRTSDVSAEAMP